MKKHTVTFILSSVLSATLLLNGCAGTATPKPPTENEVTSPESVLSNENTTKENTTEENATETTVSESTNESSTNPAAADAIVSQGGPYGEISLSIPDGWRCETSPTDSGLLVNGLYGIRFYPENAVGGYIAVVYIDWFGVCGTGLAEEQATIAGTPANIGTYDNHSYWDFISFREDYSGIVALTYSVDDWWETYSDQVMDILDTLSFDTSKKEGGAYVDSDESYLDQICLGISLKNISSTGATILFCNYHADAPTGQLEYGDDFALEVLRDGTWEEVPVALGGNPDKNYAFNAVAYTIPAGDNAEQEVSWEWLYGALSPGTYRIQKSIQDFRGPGDYDKYTVYAQFILN